MPKIMFSRFVILATCVWVIMGCGIEFTFSLLSEYIKGELGFSQHELSMVGVSGAWAVSIISLLAGPFFDRYGPVATLMASGILSLLGFSLCLAFATHILPGGSGTIMMISYAAALQLVGAWDTVGVATTVKNFPLESIGTVLGVIKTLNTVGASILSCINEAFFKGSTPSFVIFVMLYLLTILIIGSVVLNIVPTNHRQARVHPHPFIAHYVITILLLLSVVLNAFLSEAFSGQQTTPRVIAIVLAVLTLSYMFVYKLDVPPSATICKENSPCSVDLEGIDPCDTQDEQTEHSDCSTTPMTPPHDCDRNHTQPSCHKLPTPQRDASSSLWAAVLSMDFVLTATILCIGSSCGAVLYTNLAQMDKSLAPPNIDYSSVSQETTLVTLFGAGSGVARLALGPLSQKFVRMGIPRAVPWTLGLGLTLLGNLWLVYAPRHWMGLGCAAVGFGYGAGWVSVGAILADLFSDAYIGTLYCWVGVGNPLAIWLLGSEIPGRLYDRQARKAGTGDTCYGRQCFKTTLLISSAACLIGIVLGTVLSARMKRQHKNKYQVLNPKVEMEIKA